MESPFSGPKPATPEELEEALEDFLGEDEKYCTMCGTKRPLGDFHKDDARPDGHRDVCAECRAKAHRENQEIKRAKELADLEKQNLETLSTLGKGGTYGPHINELFESMMIPFGGVHGFSKQLWATYCATDPGSMKRVQILRMMVDLSKRVTELGLAERKLEMMEEADLVKVLQNNLQQFHLDTEKHKELIEVDATVVNDYVEAEMAVQDGSD